MVCFAIMITNALVMIFSSTPSLSYARLPCEEFLLLRRKGFASSRSGTCPPVLDSGSCHALGSLPRLCLRRFRKVFVIASEFLPSEPLSENASDCHKEPPLVAVVVFALIEAESLFVEIPEKVERFDADIRAFHSALEQAPKVFHPVRVDVAAHIAHCMVNDVVREIFREASVGAKRVRVNFRALQDILTDVALQFGTLCAVHYGQTDFGCALATRALQQTLHGSEGLVPGALHVFALLCRVHVASASADPSFINFNVTVELDEGTVLQRKANTVKHEPRGFLRHSKRARQFAGTHAVLRVHDHPNGRQPLFQTERGILENRADFYAELFRATTALPEAARGKKRRLVRLTARASNHVVRPAKRDHEIESALRVREVGDCGSQCLRKFDLFRAHAQRNRTRSAVSQVNNYPTFSSFWHDFPVG